MNVDIFCAFNITTVPAFVLVSFTYRTSADRKNGNLSGAQMKSKRQLLLLPTYLPLKMSSTVFLDGRCICKIACGKMWMDLQKRVWSKWEQLNNHNCTCLAFWMCSNVYVFYLNFLYQIIARTLFSFITKQFCRPWYRISHQVGPANLGLAGKFTS
jgi:hypothetical protein